MNVRTAKSLRPLLVVVALLFGCAESEPARERSESGAQVAGGIVLPLRAQVEQNVYRIAGRYRLGRESQPQQEGTLPLESRALRLSLSAGRYTFELASFSVWRSANGAAEVDVTARTTLLTPVLQVEVAEGVTRRLTLRFEVEGEPVVVSICDDEPDAVECPYGDLDGDGYPNGVECPDVNACVDSDGDGQPDVEDLDSDNDGYSDVLEPAQTDGRTDPCFPDGDALACKPNRSIEVEAEIEETCATDTCSFDGGKPPTPGALPAELNPGAIALYVYPSYRPAKGGVDFENTLARGSELRLQIVHSAGDFADPSDIRIEVFSVDALYLAGYGASTPYLALTAAPSGYDAGFTLGARAVASEALLVITVLHDTDGDGEQEAIARRVVRVEVTN